MRSLLLELLGAAQGILLSVSFFLKSRRHPSHLMMGFYLFFFSIGLLETWVIKNLHGITGNIIESLIGNSSFLYGPFLYLFVYFLIHDPSHFRKKILLHFLPFLVFFATDLITIFTGFDRDSNSGQLAELIEFELFVVQILLYNLAAILTLKKHHKTILETYSNVEERDLQWLKMLLIVITGTYVFSFTLSHMVLFGIREVNQLFSIVQVLIIICIYFMSYQVLFRPGLFNISIVHEHDQEGG